MVYLPFCEKQPTYGRLSPWGTIHVQKSQNYFNIQLPFILLSTNTGTFDKHWPAYDTDTSPPT